jgi:hypothetical protein
VGAEGPPFCTHEFDEESRAGTALDERLAMLRLRIGLLVAERESLTGLRRAAKAAYEKRLSTSKELESVVEEMPQGDEISVSLMISIRQEWAARGG